jgi:hypothetical protein
MSQKPPAKNDRVPPGAPPPKRSWPIYLYVGGLAVLLVGCIALSVTGAALPGPGSDEKISLRNVQARRSHFFHYYAFGK